jgi:hypothetical protein
MKFQRNARRYSMPLNIQCKCCWCGWFGLSWRTLTHVYARALTKSRMSLYISLYFHRCLPEKLPCTLACTEKLLQNDDVGFVELSLERLGETFDVPAFLHALTVNETVRHVCFSGTFIRDCTVSQWEKMLYGVGFLPNLQELQIWCATLPVATFGSVFQNAVHLQKVYLFQVRLVGRQEDYDDVFSPAIQHHQNLMEFRLGGIQTIVPTDNAYDQAQPLPAQLPVAAHISLDSLLDALAETRHLQILSLQWSWMHTVATDAAGSSTTPVAPFAARALRHLLSSRTMTDLYLTRLGLQPDHLHEVAAALTENATLRVLDLFGNAALGPEQFVDIANALQTNTGLETLVLPCQNDASSTTLASRSQRQARLTSNDDSVPDPETLSDECARSISDAIAVNTTLVTLSLPRCLLNDSGLRHLVQALTVNATLKKIEVGLAKGCGVDDTSRQALQSMLERNYQLERLVMTSAEPLLQDKVEYYLRLNAVGRGTLLGGGGGRGGAAAATRHGPTTASADGNDDEVGEWSSSSHLDNYLNRAAWVEMLISVRDDLDCLYYFITMNPTICQFANARQADVIVTSVPTVTSLPRRHSMLDGLTLQQKLRGYVHAKCRWSRCGNGIKCVVLPWLIAGAILFCWNEQEK